MSRAPHADAWADRYREGLSVGEIARAAGVRHSTVSAALRRRGVVPRERHRRAAKPRAARAPRLGVGPRLVPPAAACPVPGCGRASAPFLEARTPEEFRPLCAACRNNALRRRSRDGLFADEAVAELVTRALRRLSAGATRCPVSGCGAPSAPANRQTPRDAVQLCECHRLAARYALAKRRAAPAELVTYLSRRAA